ncbi:SusD/RagB family nutrient-binding outer membrane lipoprotein [Sphingobacterium sp. LRF_L2]|uniref:SusD/RagB family nutrient-binding outer membrane lipoprotein n=1 Tax=Sphingobacterium sp. LRF_L2 TaxID=3369421 RepID=UPI003F63E5F3
MKNTKTIYIVLLLITTFTGMVSCKKLSDINENPNDASTTHPRAQLPKVEWDAFTTWHGTAPLYILKMIVQTDGENANQIYNWQRGSFDQYGNLRNVLKMQEEAKNINEPSYIALAKFFRAYYFYNLTLTFGDIPYSEALQGETTGVFTPKYDTQEDVFSGILKELEEANALLKENPAVIEGDIIYGSSEKWVKMINAFRLKILMTLSKKESNTTLNVKTQFANIFANEDLLSSSDDAQLLFLDQEDNRYPEFNSSGYGSGMYMDSTFIRRLQDHKDPRLFVIASQTRVGQEAGLETDDFSAYEGGDPIVPYSQVNDKAVLGKLSKVLGRYTEDATTEPYVLMGYAEQQFIIAEAMVRGWISGDANAAYNEGVKSAFKFYETYAKNLSSFVSEDKANSYLAQDIVRLDAVSSSEDKIARIMMQKYLRSFHQGGYSAYFDHLRTGYPTLRKSANVQTAYRWMYPQAEYNYNSTNVSAAIQSQFNGNDNIQSKPWWVQ